MTSMSTNAKIAKAEEPRDCAAPSRSASLRLAIDGEKETEKCWRSWRMKYVLLSMIYFDDL